MTLGILAAIDVDDIEDEVPVDGSGNGHSAADGETLAARMSTLFARLLGSPLDSFATSLLHIAALVKRGAFSLAKEKDVPTSEASADMVVGEDASALGALLDAALLAFDVELFSALFTDWKVGTQLVASPPWISRHAAPATRSASRNSSNFPRLQNLHRHDDATRAYQIPLLKRFV